MTTRLAVASATRSHAGCVRAINEDCVLEDSAAGLWAIADGMGGHDAGDVASRVVVDALRTGDAALNARAVAECLKDANARLIGRAKRERRGTIGSTVVALLLRPARYDCIWAGDSRGYLFNGAAKRITRDHSAVQELVDAGRLSEARARRHPQAHVITRAVGVDDTLELEYAHGTCLAGDTFLLCSDGLTNMVTDGELAAFAARADLNAAADALLELALARFAPDNVSLALIRVTG